MKAKRQEYIKENVGEKSWYVPAVMFAGGFLMYILAILPILIKRGLPFFYYGDYNIQQIPFYILAHRAVRSGELFWNWNVDLGGTMSGDFSFYLWGSPFFWVTTLFPETAIPYLMPGLMAIKYGIASMSAYLYIRRYVHKYTYAMIGGFLYAFCGFNACNIVFNHFTDAVCFFPLFLLCFENLMEADAGESRAKLGISGRPFIFFALMTAFMSIVNYYFFFGQVLFLVIYYFVRYFDKTDLSRSLVRFGRALLGGLLGVFIAGFFLMQAFAGIKGNTRLDNFITGYDMLIYPSEKLIWDIIKSMAMLPDIIGKGTLFYTKTVKNASLASYIPMYGISGVVAFFLMNRKKKSWEKRLMIICFAMAMLPVLNSSFSLFNSAYYARWFYMPILMMCLFTARAAERGKTSQMKNGTIAAILFFLFFVVVYLLPSRDEAGDIVFFKMSDNNKIFLWDMFGTAFLCVLLYVANFVLPKTRGIAKRIGNTVRHSAITYRDVAVLFLVIVSCIVSTYIPVRNGSSIISDRGKEKWQEQMLFNTVEVDQTRFARGEVDSTSTNYDMVWGIPSIHCFLSTVPSEIFDFLKGAADITRTVETNIPVSRAGMRALLSGRYYFENAEISKNRVFNDGEGTDGYTYLDTQNGFDIFENSNYIPMGFTFDFYIRESEWEKLEAKEHDYDLVRALILPDRTVDELEGTIDMRELTAMDIIEDEMSYFRFTGDCIARAGSACTEFDTDTHGFSAKTSMLKDNTLVFFSVPATEGFHCQVDGERTPIYKADYGLMAIPVSGGVHDIRVTYSPEGFIEGLCMSVIGLAVLGLYITLYKQALKKVNKND